MLLRRIDTLYYILILILIIIFGGVIWLDSYTSFLDPVNTELILSLISLIIAIISIGISNAKQPRFKGKICASINEKDKIHHDYGISRFGKGQYYKVSFTISNYKKIPIKSMLVSFKFPVNKFYANDRDVSKNLIFFKETGIYTSDNLKYLGTSLGDSEITFELYFNLDSWDNKRNIYVTVTGENISPTTFNFKNQEIKDLLNFKEKRLSITK